MPQSLPTSCSNCGRLLPAPDAVCSFCERELSPNPLAGRYVCPNCGRRFERPLLNPWPPHVKWYRPQFLKPQCPQCRSLLRDRTVLPIRRADPFIVLGLVVAVYVFHPKAGVAVAASLLYVVVQVARWRRALSSVRSEQERYAIDENAP